MTPWILLSASIAALVWIAGRMWARYSTASGTPRERLCAAVQGSATLILAYASGAMYSIPALLIALADLLNDPPMRETIEAILPPEHKYLLGIGIAVLTVFARLRSM